MCLICFIGAPHFGCILDTCRERKGQANEEETTIDFAKREKDGHHWRCGVCSCYLCFERLEQGHSQRHSCVVGDRNFLYRNHSGNRRPAHADEKT